MRANWTNEQVAFLILKRSEGKSMPNTVRALNRKFGVKYNTTQCYSKLGNLKLSLKEQKKEQLPAKAKGRAGKYMNYTQAKIDFVYGCVSNNFPTSIIVTGFKEQFGETIIERQIDYIIGTKRPTASLKKHLEADTKVTKTIKELTPTKKSNMTKGNLLGELEKFMDKHGNPKTRHLSKNDKKMLGVVKELLQPEETTNEKRQEIVEEVVESLAPVYSRTRCHWTDEEEFNLVCNYYELSIDEAREFFQRPYYTISKRLEMIIDSTEPKYIELLMKASKVIKERKQVSDRAAKTGFLKRRRLRKQAKKVAKLERKLKKMRGE